MAANTAINITLQSRDWELIIGLIKGGNMGDMAVEELIYALKAYYRAQTTKPAGTANVTVASTESMVLTIANFLYNSTLYYVHRDLAGSPFNRILTALRTMNNAADNYISTEFSAMDTRISNNYTVVRSSGRKFIMMNDYDNN